MRLTLARKLLLVYLVLVGLVVAFALAIVYSSAQSRQIAATVEQTERRIMLLNGLLRDLLNAETGHRGYILTGEAPFLEPYEDALQHLPERIDALERQFQDRPAARRQLRLVAELAARKLRHMRHGIGLERAGQEAMASAQVASGEGKQLMDRLRAEIDAMISAQNRELIQFQTQRNRSLARLTGILLAVGLLVLVGVAVLGRLLVADLGRRLAHLNEATQRFGAGDLDARVTVSGHDELTRLGHSFNEMADLVAEFQQSLSASDQRLRTILDTVVDAVVTIDSDGRIVAANRATGLLFGHSEAALLGQPVDRLFEREPRTASLLHEIHALGTDRSDSANQLTGCHSDGHRFPVDVGTAVTRLGDEELLVCVIRDLTGQYRAERLKREFVSTVSHELRTPLTSISGSLDLLAATQLENGPPTAVRLVEIARSNCRRLVRLINDILDLEKIESGRIRMTRQLLEPASLIDQALKDNTGYAERFGVQLRTRYDGTVTGHCVLGDRDRLLQVLANLLSNAIKFSPPAGTVTVAAERRDDRLRIAVSDQGPGVPEDFHDRIFQRFAQADSSDRRRQDGTGLGLNISKQIVELHQGGIGFESVAGRGATFWFELPLADVPHPTGATA